MVRSIRHADHWPSSVAFASQASVQGVHSPSSVRSLHRWAVMKPRPVVQRWQATCGCLQLRAASNQQDSLWTCKFQFAIIYACIIRGCWWCGLTCLPSPFSIQPSFVSQPVQASARCQLWCCSQVLILGHLEATLVFMRGPCVLRSFTTISTRIVTSRHSITRTHKIRQGQLCASRAHLSGFTSYSYNLFSQAYNSHCSAI